MLLFRPTEEPAPLTVLESNAYLFVELTADDYFDNSLMSDCLVFTRYLPMIYLKSSTLSLSRSEPEL